jgi:hypothetical protein
MHGIFPRIVVHSQNTAKLAASNVTKTVQLSYPSRTKSDQFNTDTLTFGSRESFHRYWSDMHVGFRDPDTDEVIYSYDELVSGRHYFAAGPRIKAERDQRTTEAFDAADLERRAALVVNTAVGGSAMIEPNIKFKALEIGADLKPTEKVLDYQFDAVVVHACDTTKAITAYIVESARSPQKEEVNELLRKVTAFKLWAATSDRFKAVTEFVPVLGGRHFPAETILECITRRVSRVAPSGADYEWIRGEKRQ